MKYDKPFLPFEDQATQLIKRGLDADKDELVRRLEQVNYYRLSAYWHTFRAQDTSDPDDKVRLDDFVSGTTLTQVWRSYTFDRQLRIMVIDAIERAEVAIRTQMVHKFTREHGAFGYLNPRNFNKNFGHQRFIEVLDECVQQSSHEVFVSHYKGKYSSEKYLPLWMLVELMTFGTMFTMFKNLEFSMMKLVAKEFGITAPVLSNWLKTLNYIRNICAHHGRLWNRELAIKPVIPDNQDAWKTPVNIETNRIFGVLTVLRYLMTHIAPQSGWTCRLMDLFGRYPELPRDFMGFPENWHECPIWNHCRAVHGMSDAIDCTEDAS